MIVVLATRNRKKIEEIRRIWQEQATQMPIEVRGLDDYPDAPEVEEDGHTFAQNAGKKALSVARFTGAPALSDDSGLVVEALDGAPGVYSARYAGIGASDAENVAKLLAELAAVEDAGRGAHFECVLALAHPDGRVRYFSGRVAGQITRHPAGENGFGYDPVFVPAAHRETFAQLNGKEKDALSHRGRALAQLREALQNEGTGLLS